MHGRLTWTVCDNTNSRYACPGAARQESVFIHLPETHSLLACRHRNKFQFHNTIYKLHKMYNIPTNTINKFYFFARMRLSSTTTMPVSVLVRMSRPTPWRNFRIASGNENSPNEFPPRASIASSRASMPPEDVHLPARHSGGQDHCALGSG